MGRLRNLGPPRRGCAGFTLALAALCLVPAAGWTGVPLRRDDPVRHAVDPQALAAALDRFPEFEGAQAAVVVRDGAVVGERYVAGSAATLRQEWSVTKSVSSLLCGIAVARGFLPGVEVSLGQALPPAYRPADPQKASITVEHLLTMTSGLRWSESGDWEVWSTTPDPVAWILARPLEALPGLEYNYSTAASNLLSPILEEAAGRDEIEFAREVLFAPLGIDEWSWWRDPMGRPYAGHGLFLRTDDLAKLGVLVLQQGRWEGFTVLPRRWIRESTSVQVALGAEFGPLHRIHYGYLWWIDLGLEHPAVIAWGWAGQLVYCVPELQLVVAVNADPWVATDEEAERQEAAMLGFIVRQILPAVHRRTTGPRRPAGRTRPAGAPPRATTAGFGPSTGSSRGFVASGSGGM